MEVTLALFSILLIYLVVVITRWAIKRHSSLQLFKRYNIPGPKPAFLTGNLTQLYKARTYNDFIEKCLKEYGNVFGLYLGDLPYVVVNDLDILKQILIKDFHVFGNRPAMILDSKPLNKSIIALRDKRWKEVRSFLTPTFSSGKIKLLMDIFNQKVDITADIVSKHAEKSNMFDIYELVQALTLDVIADCAFAMKTHCQENPKDMFLIAVRNFFRFVHNSAVSFAIMFPFVRTLMTFVSNHLTAGKMTNLIVKNVNCAIDARRKDPNKKGIDILQLMLDSVEKDSKGNVLGMTDEEIVANAYTFLLAGYETTATALAFTFYLLIKHPDVQERLYQEITKAVDSSYATIQDLQYLDQVFSESLRYYPPVTGFVMRHCDADHQVGDVVIPKGARVLAPVWDIHHNPDYWPDPWKFDPDRFSSENKGSINSMAYLPFGLGRRNCIGARFAQLEAKLTIFRLVKNFKFKMCEKTDDPLTLICPTYITNPANGVYLCAVKR